MAKTSGKAGNEKSKLPVPGFKKGISKDSVQKAAATLAGGRQDPLTPPKDASSWVDKKGVQFKGWVEQIVITAAYRSVTRSGLMDVTIIGKIRQSKVKENTGKKVWGHFLQNTAAKLTEGHQMMNDLSEAKIVSFLTATKLITGAQDVTEVMLNKLFPAQNAPSANSPLLNKVVLVNVTQADEPKLDRDTRKPVLDSDGDEILVKRDRMEAALPPEEESEGDDEDEDEDEDAESDDADDSDDDDDSDDSEEDEESDDEDEDESDEEDEEDEEEQPAPPPVKGRKSKK
jgi:hypothetical protein